jgi:hypothetical protein
MIEFAYAVLVLSFAALVFSLAFIIVKVLGDD